MKGISTLAISALAALALTAAIGAASASAATVLCKTHEKVCPAGDVLPAGSYQVFGGELTLKSTTNGTQFNCYTMGFFAKTAAESGAPLPATGEYNKTGVASCRIAGEGSSCTSVSIGSTQDTVHVSSPQEGWTIGSSSAPLTIALHCLGTTCQYSATAAVEMGIASEGEFADEEATIKGAPMTRTSGFLCPGGTSFTLDYEGFLAETTYLAFSS